MAFQKIFILLIFFTFLNRDPRTRLWYRVCFTPLGYIPTQAKVTVKFNEDVRLPHSTIADSAVYT